MTLVVTCDGWPYNTPAMLASVGREREEAELQAVLASKAFAKSPSLAKLLQYICTKNWEGSGGEVKEYHLAVDVLGRSPQFDPTTSSIVRVEIHRLREKLKRFYEIEGAEHALMIQLGSGNYIPQFVRRERSPQQEPGFVSANVESSIGFGPASSGQDGKGADTRQQLRSEERSKPPHSFSRFGRIGTGLAAASVAAVLIFHLVRTSKHEQVQTEAVSGPPAAPAAAAPKVTAGPDTDLRMIAGYFKNGYIDHAGHVWVGDRYFHGGTTGTQFFSHQLARSLDPALFESFRTGEFSYDIPLKPASYEVRLYFVETKFGPETLLGGGEASRIFNVKFNGQTRLEDFDPYTDANGDFIADIRSFDDIRPSPDGYLHIQFERVKDDPFLNAIEILSDPHGLLHPIRIVMQDNTYTDRSGDVWEPDDYFSGGELAANVAPIENTSDPGLYAGERYGRFSYAIPVADGKYELRMGFAETLFGPRNPGRGGVGNRIFDVQCNGETLLRNFDIFEQAGGAGRAVVKTFHNIQPNPQGKILVTFEPVKNYALVNFIEVNEESRRARPSD